MHAGGACKCVLVGRGGRWGQSDVAVTGQERMREQVNEVERPRWGCTVPLRSNVG